jgi:Zn-dependent protease
VRLKQRPATPAQDARVGLAGPVWGAAAALAFLATGWAAGWPSWLATARLGAWVNVFNLIPIWQLDGARGFSALSRPQRSAAAAVSFLLALITGDGLLFLLAAVTAVRAAGAGAPGTGDRNVLLTYLALAAGLTAIAHGAGGLGLR